MSSLLGAVLGHLPGKVLTTDNVRSMSVDNVTDAAWPAFAGSRAALEDIAPTYLAASRRLTNLRWHGEKAGH